MTQLLAPVLAAPPSASAQLPPWWRVLTEFLYFAGFALVLGGSMCYLTVVRPALRAKRGDIGEADATLVGRRSARQLACSGVLLLVAGYGQLAARVARADPPTPFGTALTPERMWRFLRVPAKAGEWVSSGTLVLAQNILLVALAGVLLALFTRRLAPRLEAVTPLLVVLAVLATAVVSVPTKLGSKAADTVLGAILDQVHIIAGCTWLGGLASLALLTRTRRGLGERGGLFWALAWQRFSLVGLTAVGAIVTSGSWLAWKHVGGPSELATTGYGRFLLVKLLLVLTLVAAGAYNQLVLTPRIARVHATGDLRGGFALTLRRFPLTVTVETLLGCGVLLIVPFLSGSARAQAGDGPTPTVDGGVLALGALLIACLAASLYATHRVSLLRVRRAELVTG